MTDVNARLKEKIFSDNLFWAGGNTKRLRLDEINSVRDRMDRGDEIIVGDTSAWEIVNRFFKETGFLQNRLAPRLHQVFAQALLDEMGSNPTEYMNTLHRHPARESHLATMGVSLDKAVPQLSEKSDASSEEFDEPGFKDGSYVTEEVSESSEPIDYSALKVPQLKAELSKRGLSTDGYREDLVSRLQEDDESKVNNDSQSDSA